MPTVKTTRRRTLGNSSSGQTHISKPMPSLPPINISHMRSGVTGPGSGDGGQSGGTRLLPQLSGRTGPGALVGQDSKPRQTFGVSGLPLSPEDVLTQHYAQLTPYERTEILSYPEVWYLGLEDAADKTGGEEGAEGCNEGFDDEHGTYLRNAGDHVAYRYELLELLGKGSFGQVLRAYDHKHKQCVAIKIIRNKRRFLHQSLIEVKILQDLREKNQDGRHHVIHMYQSFRFRNHVCIVFELMGLNLYELLKKNKFQGFKLSTIAHHTVALLRCLRLLQRESIIHCDLKPENILVDPKDSSSVKVIDFGSSCYEEQRIYTYIQSRFYRSPEIILGLPYTTAIDMWSLGCILAELYTGYPLFAGQNEAEQLACIIEVLGPPPGELLEGATRQKVFFDFNGDPTCMTNAKGRTRRPGSRDLAQVTRCSDQLFVNFIRRCLAWMPGKRMTPQQALRHEWIAEVRQRMTRPAHTRRDVMLSKRSSNSLRKSSTDTDAKVTGSSEAALDRGDFSDQQHIDSHPVSFPAIRYK